MKHNWEFTNEPIVLWSIDFQQKCQDKSMEKKKTVFSTNGTAATGLPHTKELSCTFP